MRSTIERERDSLLKEYVFSKMLLRPSSRDRECVLRYVMS